MPNKRRHEFGQHFLKEKSIIQRILEFSAVQAKLHPTAGILEIGPGKGALTLEWIHSAIPRDLQRTFVYEKDPKIDSFWSKSYPVEKSQVHWTLGDFIKRQPDFLRKQSFTWIVFSNLPYSVGTVILETLIAEHAIRNIRLEAMVLMFQKEVAERMTAKAPSRDVSGLTFLVQNYFDVELLCKVPPGAFTPPPKVWSEVLIFRPLAKPKSETYLHQLEPLIAKAFQQRRKMLRGIFRGHKTVECALERLKLGQKRPEELAWKDWLDLDLEIFSKMTGK